VVANAAAWAALSTGSHSPFAAIGITPHKAVPILGPLLASIVLCVIYPLLRDKLWLGFMKELADRRPGEEIKGEWGGDRSLTIMGSHDSADRRSDDRRR
jgi:hypothetical protein